MSFKPVLAHKCSLAFLAEGRPFRCTCKKRVTKTRAKELIASGLAVEIKGPDGKESTKQIVLMRQLWTPAATIARGHIEAAFVADRVAEKQRIEIYGESNQRVLAGLGAALLERKSPS
jgi:hypothetical protein